MKIEPFQNWNTVHLDLRQRAIELEEQIKKHTEFGRENAFQLAAADVFVEKAQVHLTERAEKFYYYGTLCTIGVLFVTDAAVAAGRFG